MLLCSALGVLFIPCMVPCFIRLIYSVIQGMQISATPINPKITTTGEETHSLMIVKAKQNRKTATQKVLAQFEAKT